MHQLLKTYVLVLILGIGFMIGCSQGAPGDNGPSPSNQLPPNPPNDEAGPEDAPDTDSDNSGEARIGFDEINRQVFIPHCVECHGASGGVNLEGYERVVNELRAIERVVLFERAMPPPEEEQLSREQLELLEKWIKQEAR